MDSPKYNRTFHLPWSKGCTNDDKMAASVESLIGIPILITEKIDGSNVCMEHKNCFSRSHAGLPTHASFDQFKALHASLKQHINDGLQIFGEWVLARHSIEYLELPGYFLLFGLRDLELNEWCSWDDVEMWARVLGIPTVPILFRGQVSSEKDLKELTESFMKQPSACGGIREGVVVRVAREFADKDFASSIMKNVRANHVDPNNDHWLHQAIIKNKLKSP